MSGIAAIFHPQKEPINESLIKDITASMNLRGPDGLHYLLENHIGLSHAHLKVHNQVSSKQPANHENHCWITAHARIDAELSLIKKLALPATTQLPDHTLILTAYKKWGVDCLKHLIGDFAFIIWDEAQQRLFCATDQFSVNPLYYATLTNGICLSNSINTLRLHPQVSHELNPQSVADYLVRRMNLKQGNTIFKDINRLPAAHYLIVENNQTIIKPYWQANESAPLSIKKDSREYIDQFKELLTQAVTDRIQSCLLYTSDAADD